MGFHTEADNLTRRRVTREKHSRRLRNWDHWVMLVIFPDTNALHGNPYFKGKIAEDLLREVDLGDAELQFSPVVLKELQRQEVDDVRAVLAAVNNTVRKKSRGNSAKMPDVLDRVDRALDVTRREIDEQLAELAQREHVVITSWPAVSSRELGERELERRRPFLEVPIGGKSATVGHRDALIWEGVRESVRRGTQDQVLILISNDKGFWDDKQTGLHQDLRDDLDTDGVTPEHVVLVKDLAQALVKMRELRSEITSEQAAVASALISATMGLESVSVGWVYNAREGDVEESELPLDLPIELEDASVVAVDLLGDVEFVPGTKFTARQRAELSINGSMSLTDYYGLEPALDIEIWSEINDHYAEVQTTRTVVIEASMRVVAGKAEVERLSVQVD